MKQCEYPLNQSRVDHQLSDAHDRSCVFVLSNAAYQQVRTPGLTITFQAFAVYMSGDQIRAGGGAKTGTTITANLSRNDTNLVVRVVVSSATTFAVYANGQSLGTVFVDPARFYSAGVYRNDGKSSTHIGNVKLTVFDDTEYELEEKYAQAMRNPEESYFMTMEDQIKSQVDKAMADRERSLDGREKLLEHRTTAIASREKATMDREHALEAREKAVQQRETDADANGSKGEKGEKSTREDVQPPDAKLMKRAATEAWPKAVKFVLGSNFSVVEELHDKLMREWVVARGDNISSDAYDYFVYSQGVAWPKAVLAHPTRIMIDLTKIREIVQYILL